MHLFAPNANPHTELLILFFLRAPPLNYLYSVRLSAHQSRSRVYAWCRARAILRLQTGSKRAARARRAHRNHRAAFSQRTQTIQSITSGSFPGRKLRPVYSAVCNIYIYCVRARLQSHLLWINAAYGNFVSRELFHMQN